MLLYSHHIWTSHADSKFKLVQPHCTVIPPPDKLKVVQFGPHCTRPHHPLRIQHSNLFIVVGKWAVGILLELFLVTSRKRSLRRLCFHRCLSVYRGVSASGSGGVWHNPPPGRHPRQTPLPSAYWDTVNKRAVDILLELFLVLWCLSLSLPFSLDVTKPLVPCMIHQYILRHGSLAEPHLPPRSIRSLSSSLNTTQRRIKPLILITITEFTTRSIQDEQIRICSSVPPVSRSVRPTAIVWKMYQEYKR